MRGPGGLEPAAGPALRELARAAARYLEARGWWACETCGLMLEPPTPPDGWTLECGACRHAAPGAMDADAEAAVREANMRAAWEMAMAELERASPPPDAQGGPCEACGERPAVARPALCGECLPDTEGGA